MSLSLEQISILQFIYHYYDYYYYYYYYYMLYPVAKHSRVAKEAGPLGRFCVTKKSRRVFREGKHDHAAALKWPALIQNGYWQP